VGTKKPAYFELLGVILWPVVNTYIDYAAMPVCNSLFGDISQGVIEKFLREIVSLNVLWGYFNKIDL